MPALASSASKDAVHCPSWLAVTARKCTYREPVSITKKQYRRCRVTAQSTGKKSAASIVSACARRKFRQVVSVSRLGRRRDLQRLEDPADRRGAHPAVASRPVSAAISALTGGRPVRCG